MLGQPEPISLNVCTGSHSVVWQLYVELIVRQFGARWSDGVFFFFNVNKLVWLKAEARHRCNNIYAARPCYPCCSQGPSHGQHLASPQAAECLRRASSVRRRRRLTLPRWGGYRTRSRCSRHMAVGSHVRHSQLLLRARWKMTEIFESDLKRVHLELRLVFPCRVQS